MKNKQDPVLKYFVFAGEKNTKGGIRRQSSTVENSHYFKKGEVNQKEKDKKTMCYMWILKYDTNEHV